ncbi:MAG: ATP-binding protein [Elusimicrobia bacterium]|nr:ATP-binding protein [Elusimicrobiota bacterium]
MPGKKRPYKIAIISTHGTGKTTLCYDVAAALKKKNFRTKVFSEVAALACEEGVPINQTTTLPAQLYIMLTHICEELKGNFRNYEVVVCDRSVFDNWIYLERRCGRQSNSFILDFIGRYAEQFPYDAVYKLPLVGELVPDGIRDAESREFQSDIYARLNGLLDELSIPHITLPIPQSALRNEWCDIVLKETLSRLWPAARGVPVAALNQ